MTTAYTSLLGLALPVQGELAGTWGDVVNTSITALVDTSVAGTTNVSTDANVTLTTTTGASNQARQAILLFSGARTAIRTVTAPAQSKIYTVINATTGGFAVTLVGAGPTTGVTIANGARTVVAWNGSDFVEVSSPSSIILPGGTANGVLYLNGSKVVTSGSALTFDGTDFGVSGGNARINRNSNSTILTLGGSPSANWEGDIQFVTSNTETNWRVASNRSTAGSFTITPSTAGGGSTFSTPAINLSSSGNLGLGVTPSASTLPTIQSTYGVLSGNTNVSILRNAYYNSGWKYTATGAATFYQHDGGSHIWYNAPSGTAGNAISFTQAMTLDASGNLGVGTTSPALQVDVQKSDGSGRQDLLRVLAGGNSTNNGASIALGSTQTQCGYITGLQTASTEGALVFGTQSSGAYAERARIAAAGGLSIAGGLAVGTLTSYPTNIFFSGNVVSAGAGVFPLKWNNASGIVTYDTSSRLVKTNIEDSPYGLAEVLQLKSRKYQRIDSQQNEIGLVADEVLPIMPEFVPLVEKSLFTKDEADTELIAGGVNYDKLTSVLIKAIQEQQAIIESLKARLDAANL